MNLPAFAVGAMPQALPGIAYSKHPVRLAGRASCAPTSP